MPDTEPASDVRGSSDEALRRALLALKDLRARAERAEGAATEPIAIIGIGCRFPAGANSPAEYWDLLRSGRDGVGTMPDGRWDREAYFDPDPEVAGKIYTDQGGFLDQPIDTFDAAFFGIAPVEARDLDPQQRLLLEVTWEALEHAGVAPDRLTGSATGVFVGMSTFDYSNLVRDRDPEDMGTYSGTGVSGAVAAGRLSYVLGLRGPAMCLDTACSSSLVALSLATQSLRAGACRMALAGGVNLVLDPQAMISLSLLRALSATGRCHTFGAEADGYARGEGAGMVVLKRLSDAQADGDRILAVVRSAAVNHDGRSSGLTVPSGPAQREVIERALTEAGLQPADVDLVEAHGTGTHLGDPIEVRALDAVYSRGRSADHPLLIGSAKTNIGHLEAAAGIAGVIKTVLALQHEEVPPHLHCEELSPHIAWSTMPIEVTRELRPWPRGERARRGAVSAFGFSGTNAHVILEEAPLAAERGERTPTPVVITLSARDDAALATLARATGDALADADLADLAWTLQDGRALLRRRLAVTASTTEEAADRLRSWDPAQDAVGITTAAAATRPRVAFVFTGQGAQLPRMGRDLYEQEPVFRAALDECDVALRPRLEHALIDVLYGDDDLAGLIHHTQYTQPAMFALQYGLTALWRSWGITPDVVVGHSIGEYAAAVAAGVMDVSTAVDLIAARGALMGALPSGGKMVAVFADEARVAALIAPHSANVSIAANNGASSVVISGEGPSIDMILADLDGASIRHRALEVSHAFHSPLMSPMVAAFDEHTRRAVLREPTMTFVSTVSGVAESALIASPAYWRDQVLATVRFGAAIDSIVGAGIEQFLEIGPQPTLLGMIARIRGSEGLHASLRPATGAVGERSDRAQMLDALGGLWAAGREPNWRAIDGGRSVKVDAPTYPFQRQRHWIDPPRHRSHSTGGHPLLGVATHAPTLGAMIHESTLSVDSPAWLDDHRLAGIAVLPGSAFAEMALAAADSSDTIESLNIHEALVLPANGDVTVQTIVTGPANRQEVQILSLEPGDVAGGGWKVHATATMLRSTGFATGNEPLDLGAAVAGFDEDLDVGAYYAQLQSVGLMYGPTFRGVTRLLRRDGAALGHVRLPPSAVDARRYRLHPALLDACFHVLGAAIAPPDLSSDDMFVPVAFEGVRVGKAGASSVWCAGTLIGDFSSDARSITARIEIFDDSGSPVGSIDRLVARRTPKAFWAHAAASAGVFDDLYEVAWRPQVRPQVAAQDVASMAWVIIADDEVSAGPLVANLLGAGAAEVSVQAPFDADRLGQLLGNGGGTTGVVSLCTTDGAVVGADRALVMAETVLQQPLAVAQALAARSADDTRLWFVTRGAHSVDGEPPDVVTSLAWGLARTVANEQPQLGCVCIDIDAGGGDDEYDELALELIAGAIDTRAPEDQVALRGRRRSVARLVRHDVGLHTPPKSPYRVTLAERGSFDQLSFATLERRSPLDGEVEIEVRASGINFRDVLNVLGMYPGNPGLPGLECAGIVTAVGSGVRDLAVGDAVFGIAPQAFDSHVVTQADLVVLKPSTITFAEAATLPIAFLTAEYGLSTLAGLQRGETVLIHAAAGGVGMAAVSLAQRLGAEVFATVGSARKRRTLEALGVTHIYDSRTLDFAEQILADTDGKGVDVVLNSLADEFIDRSFRSLAQAGRFLEIGKRGIWSAEQAAAVRPKGRYHVYDLSDFFIADRNGVQVSLQGVADGIADGSIAPLPLRAFSIQAIRDAFRFVAQARHIGKVVLTHRAHGPLVRDDGAYVVTGGLGGIGLEMASWLVEQGARHLTLTGRSSPSADAERAIEVMASRGATVTVVQGDIAVASDVQRVLSAAAEGGVALRGVFHAAGVLDDGVLAQQSWSRFAHVLAPKLLGALLLDEATRDADLDHFVLFSSAAAVLGSPGQANYVAANTALDTLARRRRATGRTALSINWGAWAEVGMAARLQVRDHERLADRGIGSLSTAAGLDALERLLLDDAAQVAVMSMDWARLLGQMGEADRPVLLSELAAAATRVVAMESGVTDDGGLPAALEAAAPLLRRSVSVNYVTRNLVRVLGLPPDEPIDGDQDLAELGLDSLMSVELTNRLRSGTGLSLPASLPYDHPSIHRLADHLLGLFGDVDALADLAPTRAAAMAAVVPVDRGSPLPASSAQARLLFVDRLVPGLAIYNIPVALRLRGELDVGALRSSVMSLVDRHEALRTNFVLSGERYMQQIVPTEDAVVPFVIHTDPVDPAVIDDVLREEAARPFDLVHDAKLRAALYRSAVDEHVLALTMHHIATDGWSIVRLVAELGQLYSSAVVGEAPTLAEPQLQYADWSAWQLRIEDESLRSADRLSYWVDALRGPLPVLGLPLDHHRPALQSFRGGTCRVDLDSELYARVKAAAREAGASPFEFMLAAYFATIARWSGQDDVIVGTASANRQRPETHDVVGMFVNMVAIRAAVDLDTPFHELIDAVKASARGAFAHEDVPFDRIVEAINPPRDMSRSVGFQAFFVLVNLLAPTASLAGLEVDTIDVSVGETEYDIACWVTEVGDAARVKMDFNADVFDGSTVERLLGHWKLLLAAAAFDSSVVVGELALVPEVERGLLVGEFASSGVAGFVSGVCRLDELVGLAVRAWPDRVAFEHCGECVSFGELDARVNRLARRLLAAGVVAGGRVGVGVDRSLAMVVGVLAVLRVGAAYVPLDPGLPGERLSFMVADSGVSVVLASPGLLDVVDLSGVSVVDVVAEAGSIAALDAGPVVVDTSGLAGGGVAWVIYTSGSTGLPKGVEVEHASALSFVVAMAGAPGVCGDDVLLAVPALSFDPSVLDLFVPLLVGARVVIADRDDVVDARRLAGLIESSGATVMQATPTTWSMLLESGWVGSARLKVLCGGEVLPVELARRLRGVCASVWNLYGPTETTVWSAVHEVTDASLVGVSVPVGRPIPGMVYRVLDSAGGLAPIGVVGEVVIGGVGVARGYVNRVELTAQRFVVDPFDAGGRVYRSGDLARWLPDGNLEFLGRSDFQVKLRGNRVELGEIEAVLRGVGAVADAVVVADGQGVGMRLIAYLVRADPEVTSSVTELRAWLRERLPDYMVPSAFVWLDQFPLTPSRKIDRKALPSPEPVAAGAQFVAPRDDLERVVGGIFAEVLGVERVGVEDDFFELGGHSLHATSVLAKLESTFGVAVDLRAFFLTPTVAHTAALVASNDSSSSAPMVVVDRGAPLGASSVQQRLLFVDRFVGGLPVFNLPLVLRLQGDVDEPALAWALGALVARHEALRTNFELEADAWMQVVVDAASAQLPWALEDVDGGWDDVLARAQLEVARPFDLGHDVKLRGLLLRHVGGDRLLVITMHHIAVDGWSLRLLLSELVELYSSRVQDRAAVLPELPVQYLDYTVWQRELVGSGVLEGGLAYWADHLSGVLPVLDLPTDHRRPPVQSYRSGVVNVGLSAELLGQVRAAAREAGVTPFVFLLAGYLATLARWSGQDDFVVGTAVANRPRAELDHVVGMFVNTLALRAKVDVERPFSDLLAEVKRAALGGFAHQSVPFDQVVEQIAAPRDLSRSVVFQTMFMLNNLPAPEGAALPGVVAEAISIAPGRADGDLTVSVIETGDTAIVGADFNADVFDASTVERLLEHWQLLIAAAADDVSVAVGELALVSEAERGLLLGEFASSGAVEVAADGVRRLDELVAARCVVSPGSVAVVSGGESVTHAELMDRVHRLAGLLVDVGVRPGDRVGVAVERSVAMVVSLLAVLEVGAAFVPLDPSFPAERLAYMVGDAGLSVVLVSSGSLDGVLDLSSLRVVDVVAEAGSIAALDAGPVVVDTSGLAGGGVAYVIYTSGSTGQPKGVEVEHASVVNFVRSMAEVPGFTVDDVLLAVTTLSFDISVLELFVPLVVGGRVVIADRDDVVDGRRLASLIDSSGATVMQATPTTWSMLFESGWAGSPGLRVLCGGEAMPVDLGRRLVQGCRAVWNMFGPTETTVWSTVQVVDEAALAGGSVPIGRPIANTVCRVLDSAGGLAPVGVPGELFIGGVGVARGYLHRPELTAQRFVADPFDAGARLYRTGDLARWLPDGRLECLGRLDFQVKVRGHRIELGEIESLLRAHAGVVDAVVVADGVASAGRLLAYIIAAEPESPPTVGGLRSWLQQRLPDYMIPSRFLVVESFPLTANRKIDRNALPRPDAAVGAANEYVAPRDDVERVVAGIFAEVLGVERVGVEDDFFELGGHSLHATNVLARIETTCGVAVDLRAFFLTPTVAHTAALVASNDSSSSAPLVVVDRGAPVAASSVQQRLLFVDRFVGGLPVFNLPLVLRLVGDVDEPALVWALGALVARHEALRTNFQLEADAWMQVVVDAASAQLPWAVEDVDGGWDDVLARAQLEVARPFDLHHDVKLRGLLLRHVGGDRLLVITMHHIAVDGWSLRLLVSELVELYSSRVQGRAAVLAELPVQYLDYAVWQRELLGSGALEDGLGYWAEHLGGVLPVLDLPTDHRRPPVQSYRSGLVSIDLSAELLGQVRAAARDAGVTPFVFLLAGYLATLARWSGQDDFVVGTAVANRPRAELDHVVGMFVNTLALRASVDVERPFSELLAEVKRAALGGFAHQSVPFDQVVDQIAAPRDLSRSVVFQTMFMLNNLPAPDRMALSGVVAESISIAPGRADGDLTVSVIETGDTAIVGVDFNADVFDGSTVERLLGHWKLLLAAAAFDSSVVVGELALVPEVERGLLVGEFASSGVAGFVSGVCRLDELVGLAVRAWPDRVAFEHCGECVSFGELDARVNRLARRLLAAGVVAGGRVGVGVDRSLAMVVGVLAVLRVGAAYVPLDPGLPGERLSFMVADSGVSVVLASPGLLDVVDLSGVSVVDVVAEAGSIAALDAGPVVVDTSGLAGGGVAWVIYTSGSTGLPKGVEVEHASALSFVVAMAGAPGVCGDDVLLAVPALSFDPSVLDLFVPLLVGARVVIADRDDVVDARRLAGLIESSGATVMQATPTTWSMLLESGWVGSARLKVLCGGEVLPVELARRLRGVCASVWNLYGPTETTVWSAVHEVTDASLVGVSVPVGRPIPGMVYRVLDSAGGLAPIGVVGEVVIGGVGVARGYVNRVELTAQRFVVDPFDAGGRVYRSGDLARWLPDGNLEFLGRSDFQVKLRGNRVELGEIEAVLRGVGAVADAVVVADGQGVGMRLIAYLVRADPEVTSSVTELRAWLRERLPDYMVPSAFVWLDQFPLTPSRKIDRKALPSPEPVAAGAQFVAPRDDLERVVGGIFAEVLGVERVGVEDDFFELGGHSLHATSVLAKLESTFGVAVDLRAFFLTPTVAHTAATLTTDASHRARVQKVAQLRARLAAMSPAEVAAELAARRGRGENGSR